MSTEDTPGEMSTQVAAPFADTCILNTLAPLVMHELAFYNRVCSQVGTPWC